MTFKWQFHKKIIFAVWRNWTQREFYSHFNNQGSNWCIAIELGLNAQNNTFNVIKAW